MSRIPSISTRKAFTLIELLVVIAIIAILAAILFPVFAQAREKARQAACISNLKQFSLAILQYAQDADECMPMGVNGKLQVGPGMLPPTTPSNAGEHEWGVHDQIMNYVKNRGVFQCPDDGGFLAAGNVIGNNKLAVKTAPQGMELWNAYGTSYKFTKENFGIVTVSEQTAIFGTNQKYQYVSVKDTGADTDRVASAALVAAGDTSSLQAPPNPMPLAYFALPAQTRVMRCFVAPWNEPDVAKAFHKNGDTIAFADGHVKFVISQKQYDSFCDGPTFSPIRVATGVETKNGDGSCNSAGQERWQR